jgi:type II restriction enzyme
MGEDEPWRNLGFDEAQAAYVSGSQNARVWTEGWVASRLYCPNCGASSLTKHPNNRPVADFVCEACGEDYELKSQKSRFGAKVNDGAYRTMMERLQASNNPNLMLMNYDRSTLSVTNLIIVPRQFFTPRAIAPRAPLSEKARRAGWQGCNILLGAIPEAGKIWLLRDREWAPKAEVRERWQRACFLRDEGLAARGWLIETLKCVETLGRSEFKLEDVYGFERRLSELYPENRNVRAKIRQQLQVLRDNGYLQFLGRGVYRLRNQA